MDFNQLNSFILKTAEAVKEQESFFTGVLAKKAEQLAEVFPYDITVVGMYNFLNKRANSQSMISRSELKKTYNTLYSNNNKFATYFADELGTSSQQEAKQVDDREGEDLLVIANKNVDSNLVDTLSSLFDGGKNAVIKTYTKKAAVAAEKNTIYTLNSLGIHPKLAEVVAGNDAWLVCRAAFETPKGETSALVPVEIVDGQPVLPNSLVSSEGLIELTASTLSDYLTKNAGKLLKINAEQVLNFISKQAEPLSEVELALFRLKTASGNEVVLDAPGVLLQNPNLDRDVIDVQMPSFEVPEEYQSVGERLSSKAGEAELIHGKQAINKGRELILRKLSSFGYQAQVGVASSDKEGIVYAASIDGIRGFKVPVKIANSQVLLPTMVVTESSIKEFSPEGISEVMHESNDLQAMAMASPLYDLKPQELFVSLAAALQEENFDKAEDALHILRESGDSHFYNMAFNIYKQALKGEFNIQKQASCGCSHPVKTANSSSLICSHTGLAVNKVYQDKFGQCRPLHRRGMEDGSESAHFVTSKVYWNC
jgi:hypothetical protein